MKLQYKFDLKIQLAYGVLGFVLSLAILFLFLNKVMWIPALIGGIGNFLVAGYYTDYCRTC